MLIDCTTCVARDIACDDCVITVLLATPPPARRDLAPDPSATAPDVLNLDDAARYALGNLADVGLVPPLRLVAALPAQEPSPADPAARRLSGIGREIA